MRSAPAERACATPNSTAVVTAMVYPGALPATPITTDSKNERAPAFSSVFMRSVAVGGGDADRARPQRCRLEQQRIAILMGEVLLRMRIQKIFRKHRDTDIVERR